MTEAIYKRSKMKNRSIVIISILGFFLISLAYFIVPVSQGKKINQHDIVQFKGMSKEIVDHRASHHEEPLWTNSMFGGMPAYLVSTQYKNNMLRQLHRIFTLNNFRPVGFIFLYLTCAYIALLLFGAGPWLSFAGAIAYAFSSYFFIVIQAGHVSKVFAIGYLPPIVAGVYAAFRGKAILGSLIAGIFLGLQILVNHLQITYYTMLIILIFLIFEFVNAIRNKTIPGFIKPIPWLFLFILLAIGSNFSNLYTTYEYGKYSIRGRSDLTSNPENKTSGLDRDYVTQWSYGVGETFTLLIPDFMGGSSSGALKTSSNTYEYIKNTYGVGEAKKFISNVPLYWGKQPGTSGPVYIGAVVAFLFVLGMFLVRGPIKWWLFTVTLISILLSWGHNFSLLTNFMLDYFPGYNKFRSVSMALVMAEFAMPVLGILCLREIINGNPVKKEFLRAWKYSFFGLGGLILILLMISGSFDMTASFDEQFRSQGLDKIVDAIQMDRLSMLRSDAFRSLVLIILTAALSYFVYVKKVKLNTFILIISLLLLIDMWPVNKRYLNNKDFVTAKADKNPFVPTTSDLVILQDKDPDFRVINLTVSVLQDASTSYFHKSLGGYHGAKMKRYQELFDHSIGNELSALIGVLQKRPKPESVDSVLATLGTLNMLNTRYIIFNSDAPPLVNKHEMGNAWFADSIMLVPDADAEISAVALNNPENVTTVDARFSTMIEGLKPAVSESDTIYLTDYKANNLKYSYSAGTEKLAVFSEIYYDKGWEAYIDGIPADHFRANYILRSMRVPAGNHTIEFKFHPQSYYLGEKVSLGSSLLLLLVAIGFGWMQARRKAQFNTTPGNS